MSEGFSKLIRAKVFISHNHADKPVAVRISKALLLAGHEVWLDKWEMLPGDSLIEKISEGLTASSCLLVLLSKKSVEAPWVKRELDVALTRQLKEKSTKVIPCLLEDCDIPIFLQSVVYADFRENFKDGLESLLPAIKMVDPYKMGRLQKGEEPWTHEHAVDWGISQADDGFASFKVTLVSHSPLETYSVYFSLQFEVAGAGKKRIFGSPEKFRLLLLVSFMLYVIDALDRMRKESKLQDVGIMLDSNNEYHSDIGTRDVSGVILGNVHISARRIGIVPDNCVAYYYGEIVQGAIHEAMEHIRSHIEPDFLREYQFWLAENPFNPNMD